MYFDKFVQSLPQSRHRQNLSSFPKVPLCLFAMKTSHVPPRQPLTCFLPLDTLGCLFQFHINYTLCSFFVSGFSFSLFFEIYPFILHVSVVQYDVSCGFSWMPFIRLRKFPYIPYLLSVIMKGCFIFFSFLEVLLPHKIFIYLRCTT